MAMRTSGVKMDFEKLIQKGEKRGVVGGFCVQTPNGTAHWRGTGHNRNYPYTAEQLPPDATHPEGRSNRTGE